MFNLEEKFEQEYNSLLKKIKKPSVLVVGGTGVGKSTLVNLIFKKEIAKVGVGEPETRGIHKYINNYINIYDSEGYETGEENQKRFSKLIFDFIDEKSKKVETTVNVILYCISAPSARITDIDIDIIKKLKNKRIPIALILTQIDVASEEQCDSLKETAYNNISDIDIFETSIDETIIVPKGLNELNEWILLKLPNSLKDAFISVSSRNIEEKYKRGHKFILGHVAAAFTAGFTPIPVSDAPILLANQTVMIAELGIIWDIGGIKSVMGAGVIESVLPFIGKTLVGNIMKFIPGLGTITGGIINGIIGASLTYGLGEAVNLTCKKITEDALEGKDIHLDEYFNEGFKDLVRQLIEAYKK